MAMLLCCDAVQNPLKRFLHLGSYSEVKIKVTGIRRQFGGLENVLTIERTFLNTFIFNF